MDDPIYLNHAGTSWPKPNWVTKATIDAMHSHPSAWPNAFEHAHQDVCRFFGVENPDQLLLTPGCTASLSIAVSNVDLPAGCRVLTSSWEHHALHGPLQKLQEKGIVIQSIPASNTRPFDTVAFEKSLAESDVGMVAVTAACNVTGDLLPIQQIVELAHRYDAMVLVDAAQVVGWIDLQFDRLGADILAFGGHKGLQAPWGIGGLYISDSAFMKCSTAQCAIPLKNGQEPVADESTKTWADRPGYCDAGSVDQCSLSGLAASLQRLSQTSRAEELRFAQQQADKLRETLCDNRKITLYGNDQCTERLPTIAFSIADESSARSANRLRQHGLLVGSGIQCSPLSHETLGSNLSGLVRISIGLQQSAKEVEIAIKRLQAFVSSV